MKFFYHWKILLRDPAYRISLFVGLVVFVGSFVALYFFGNYNDKLVYPPVGDFILDRIPTYDLEWLFTWGFYASVLSTIFYCVFLKPELAPFMLKTFGLMMIIRSCFITLTHVGPPAGFFYANHENILEYNPLSDLFFKNDLFFSGHTAVPFLAFLLLKGTKFRWFMFVFSFIMGATVLLMHVHYSIDVFAAFFISYGVYSFTDKILNRLNLRFVNRVRLYGWSAMRKNPKV